MRHALGVFTLIHAVAHLPGFLAPGPRLERWAWLLLSMAFAVLAAGIWTRGSWWLAVVLPLVMASSVFCFLAWPLTRYGLLANLMLLVLTSTAIRSAGPHMPVSDPRLDELWGTAHDGQAVRLWMHGDIKLGARWCPFSAEQVISPARGMIWTATVSMFGLPVRGADQLLDGKGSMRWKMFDLITVADVAGPDVTRSARERMEAEARAWLYPIPREEKRRIVFNRWGNPEGGAFHEGVFGVEVEEERVFSGRKVPSRIHAGWYADSPRFETEGVFFRATIDRAEYR